MKSFFSALKSSIATVSQPSAGAPKPAQSTANQSKQTQSSNESSQTPSSASLSSTPPVSIPPKSSVSSSSASPPLSSSLPLSSSVPTDFYRVSPRYVRSLSSDLFSLSTVLFDHSQAIQKEMEDFVRYFDPVLTKCNETLEKEKIKELAPLTINQMKEDEVSNPHSLSSSSYMDLESLLSCLTLARIDCSTASESSQIAFKRANEQFESSQQRMRLIRAELNEGLKEAWESKEKVHQEEMKKIKSNYKQDKEQENKGEIQNEEKKEKETETEDTNEAIHSLAVQS
jgi:hypothetical protein